MWGEQWFLEFSDYDTLMQERHGPNQLLSIISHHYLYKRYDRALEGALAYLRIVDAGHAKVSNTREATEMAIHAAVKLGRLDVAEKLLERKQTTIEPGFLLVQGSVYKLCGRWGAALSSLVRYSQLRRMDYVAWEHIASCFYQQGQTDTNSSSINNHMSFHIASLAIGRALRIMTSSRWALSIDFVRRRYERNLSNLQDLARKIEAAGGETEAFIAWMQQQQDLSPKRLASVGLAAYDTQDIKYVYLEWLKRHTSGDQEAEDEEREDRPVRDL